MLPCLWAWPRVFCLPCLYSVSRRSHSFSWLVHPVIPTLIFLVLISTLRTEIVSSLAEYTTPLGCLIGISNLHSEDRTPYHCLPQFVPSPICHLNYPVAQAKEPDIVLGFCFHQPFTSIMPACLFNSTSNIDPQSIHFPTSKHTTLLYVISNPAYCKASKVASLLLLAPPPPITHYFISQF